MEEDGGLRKVELDMIKESKYEIIKKLVDSGGNKNAAAIRINCSVRHVNRLIKGYKKEGKAHFSHGNSGRKPVCAISEEERGLLVDLYNTKYADANFTHYVELLGKNENIFVSVETVRSLLASRHTLSPKAKRATRKRVRRELQEKLKTRISKKETTIISRALVDLDQAHPRRPRCANFGEMLQMDASEHLWFGDLDSQLHVAIDDCTGAIVGAYFERQETLKGYYNVAHQVLVDYGIPFMFYTDRRTVFEYRKKDSPLIDEDTFTQFSYACKQLGIQIKTTSVPQAKGRVERLFGTLQSRLPIELRLAGVTTIERANAFLNHYVKEFNAKFSSIAHHTKSVFDTQPSLDKINLTLAVLGNRKIDNGHCIRFENKFYKTVNSYGVPAYYHKGTEVMVIKAFDGNLFASVEDKVYSLQEIPSHEHSSRNFSFTPKPHCAHNIYIPAMSHPWKISELNKFAKSQKLFYENLFMDVAHSECLMFTGS